MDNRDGNPEQESAAKEVMDYVLTEYTRDGVHCRSSNLQSGVFECVLPQVFPNMGLLMQDLCDSGVYDVEYHADSRESRFLVYVGNGMLASTLKNRAATSYKPWTVSFLAALSVVVCVALAPYVNHSNTTGTEL